MGFYRSVFEAMGGFIRSRNGWSSLCVIDVEYASVTHLRTKKAEFQLTL